MRHRLGSLAILLLGSLACLGAEPRLLLGQGSLRPWSLVQARVESEGPLLEELRVVGRDWEGGSRLLFRGEAGEGLDSVEVAFYLDGSLKSLHLEWGKEGPGEGGRGPEFELSRDDSPPLPSPPFHPAGLGLPPRVLSLLAPDLEGQGREAAAALFRARPPFLSAALLLLLGLGALVLARLRTRAASPRGRALLLGAALCLGLGLGAGALAALPPERVLYLAALPRPAGGEGGRSLDYRGAEEREGWLIQSWGEGGERVFGARLGPGRLLPLELLGAAGARIRLSYPPLVLRRPEGLFLEGPGFLTGWISHD